MTICHVPADKAKHLVVEEIQIEMEGFWNKEVIVVMFYGNPWILVDAVAIITGCCFCAAVPVVCVCVIVKIVMTDSARMSRQMEKDRRNMLISLIWLVNKGPYIVRNKRFQMSSFVTLAFIIVPGLIYIFLTRSMRCGGSLSLSLEAYFSDLINLLVAATGGVYPNCLMIYLIGYKPYRTAMIELLKKFLSICCSQKTIVVVMGQNSSRRSTAPVLNQNSMR